MIIFVTFTREYTNRTAIGMEKQKIIIVGGVPKPQQPTGTRINMMIKSKGQKLTVEEAVKFGGASNAELVSILVKEAGTKNKKTAVGLILDIDGKKCMASISAKMFVQIAGGVVGAMKQFGEDIQTTDVKVYGQ